MKNQILGRLRAALLWGLFLTLWFGFSACSGVVEGKFYFDENGNNIMDSDEIGVPYVKVSILKDNKVIREGFTRQDGSFSFKKDKGVYYLKMDLSTVDYDLARQHGTAYMPETEMSSVKLLDIANDDGGDEAEKSGASELKGLKSADDSTETEDDAATADTKEGDENKESKDDTGSESSSAKEGPEGYGGYVKGAGHKIVSNNSYSRLSGVTIPVGFDRDSPLSKIPTQAEQTCFTGTTCEVKLFSFADCSMELEIPPDVTVDKSSGWDQDVTLNLATYEIDSTKGFAAIKASSESGKIAPKLKTVILPLKVSEDAKEGDFQLQPTIYCPYEDEIKPRAKTLKIKHDIEPEVTLEYSGFKFSGSDGEIRISVENKGESTLSGDVIVTFVELTALSTGKLPTVTFSGSCKNIGNGVTCKVSNLGGGKKAAPFNVKIINPITIGGAVSYKVDALFRSKELKEDVAAVTPITVSIPMP